MNDCTIAGMILACLVGLAVAAPIWGIDTSRAMTGRDGIERDAPYWPE